MTDIAADQKDAVLAGLLIAYSDDTHAAVDTEA
jgi:hypothetical protein